MDKVDAMPVPATASEKGGTEVLRAFVVEGQLHVALRRSFDEPEVWGLAIADIARHAARIFANETKLTERAALEKIRHMFDAELDSPTDLGATNRVS
jgi:hypothetical protein